MRYFFHIAYNGYNYHGWQRQVKDLTVQQTIEDNLSKILKAPTICMGCGRTDAKVHASQYFFHVDVAKDLDYDLAALLNKVLPDDVTIFEIVPVSTNNHAQFDVISRTYDYYIHIKKDPFLSQLSSFYTEKNLNLNKMYLASHLLCKYSNYYSFCKSPDKHNSTFCKINFVHLFANDDASRIRVQINANRYLRNMIRIIVVRLLAIAKGKMSLDEFEEYFVAKKPGQFSTIALPQGLYLSRVKYSFLDISANDPFVNNVQWKKIE